MIYKSNSSETKYIRQINLLGQKKILVSLQNQPHCFSKKLLN